MALCFRSANTANSHGEQPERQPPSQSGEANCDPSGCSVHVAVGATAGGRCRVAAKRADVRQQDSMTVWGLGLSPPTPAAAVQPPVLDKASGRTSHAFARAEPGTLREQPQLGARPAPALHGPPMCWRRVRPGLSHLLPPPPPHPMVLLDHHLQPRSTAAGSRRHGRWELLDAAWLRRRARLRPRGLDPRLGLPPARSIDASSDPTISCSMRTRPTPRARPSGSVTCRRGPVTCRRSCAAAGCDRRVDGELRSPTRRAPRRAHPVGDCLHGGLR